MSFVKYAIGALLALATAILTLSSNGFFAKPESYYLFMAYRFRYDVAFITFVLLLIFFSKEIAAYLMERLEARSASTRIAYGAIVGVCAIAALWIVRYDLVRYAKERVLYFEQEFARDYSRFLTLVGDQRHFNGQFTEAEALWKLAGGERNVEKVRITDERRELAAKIFASLREFERKNGPNIDTYFGTMQATYLYPQSEEYTDKIKWYINALQNVSKTPCSKLSPKEYWVYYGQHYELKPHCEGVDYRGKWFLQKISADFDKLIASRANSNGIFELLAMSEADTLSNKGHEIIAKSFPARIYHRAFNFTGEQDFVEGKRADESASGSADEGSEDPGPASDDEQSDSSSSPNDPHEVLENEPESSSDDNVGELKADPVSFKQPLSDPRLVKQEAASDVVELQWPVRRNVLRRFGSKQLGMQNDGIDIEVPEGSAVLAAGNGVVIYAGDGLKDLGKSVLIRHDNGMVTVYGHNRSLEVRRGLKVTRGQKIAISGVSAEAATPLLHFEVRKNSSPEDPLLYLPDPSASNE
ncbi:M23 family metallopeptidase [Rhizobium leguminosarum]|uniref:M23 family metallopeptidase n=1 Tax=Rhizobium leguminosarum TaxID=384 RepID=UPI000421254D|nr:M23 family metallopeptidase [Rhizobium leguminosarum]